MKKLLWIPVFLLVVFAGDRLVAWLFEQQVAESKFRFSRLYKDNENAEIVIVGNSRALCFYKPYVEKVSGKPVFSLCYLGMPSELTAALTMDFVDRCKSIKKIVLEVSVVEMSDEKLIPSFTTYMKYSSRLDTLLKVKANDSWKAAQVSHLFRYNNEAFYRALVYRNKLDNEWFSDRTITPEMAADVANYSVEFKTSEERIKDLKTIADYCKARNIEVEFLMGPFFPKYEVKNLDRTINRIKEVTGVTVKDYSKLLNERTYFSDFLHTNLKGGEKVVDQMYADGLLSISAKQP